MYEKDCAAEDDLYATQVADIELWWKTDRFKGIQRPYTAHDVASKRGTQQAQYPSSVMARKLFSLLQERHKAGTPVHTRGWLVCRKRGPG